MTTRNRLTAVALAAACANGAFAMEAAGFKIEKLPGPWGKREMVRAGRDK